MLSVGGSGGRSRSKSPGRRDERSRSRDIRAPSPSRRAPVASSSRSKKYYEEDEDSQASGSEDDRRRDYSRAIEKVKPRDYDRERDHDYDYDHDHDHDRDRDRNRDRERRRGYSDEGSSDDQDDDLPRSDRYADSRRRDPGRKADVKSRSHRRDDSRVQDYEVPGQFEDDDSDGRGHSRRDKVHYASSEQFSQAGHGYQEMPKYQYASMDPREVKYVNKPAQKLVRVPGPSGPTYVRNPSGQVLMPERSRHRRTDSRDDGDQDRDRHGDKYRGERSRDYEYGTDRKKELVRLEKERLELELLEEKRRQLDHLKKEREERGSDLKQKHPKSVTIRDDRDYREDDYDRKEERRNRHQHDDDDDDRDLDRSGKHSRSKGIREDRYEEYRDSRQSDRYEIEPRHGSTDRRGKPQVVEIVPGGRGGLDAPRSPGSGRPHRLSVSGHTPGALSLAAPGAPSHNRKGSFGAPPGSPLLESYKGTYQTISPMPSPMALAHHPDDSDLSDLDIGVGRKKNRRRRDDDDDDSTDDSDGGAEDHILGRAKPHGHYDPAEDAMILAADLKRGTPSPEPLIEILPHLRNDSILALRTEYKKHAKIQGKGINLAKHIKLKIGTTNLGKAAYATALGRWESEAHWANVWYQSGSSRRELLIEALIGRSNAEVEAIKDAFSDKRYGNSLVRCMESELKKDKFRTAVLKVLEAKRGEERDEVDIRVVRKDITDLHKAVTSKDGGETALINIILARSDSHLRLLLSEYEKTYGKNFARTMIAKSQNLVGETLAHILNGVLNRPMRDALLLHQAIEETSKDRAELIISRLVRFHWEPRHLARIQTEYRKRYGVHLAEDIELRTKGDFSAYCVQLCKGAQR